MLMTMLYLVHVFAIVLPVGLENDISFSAWKITAIIIIAQQGRGHRPTILYTNISHAISKN